ncbi:MAG: relaxase domain-containing protein [Rhodospirillaceae bacterium]|nr:relaxase domain-containing protein [Rhodospirillaceae bacterium]
MVATVTPLRSSAQAVSYFEKDGYYAKDDPEHRDASFWQGKAARDTGLRGHVLPGEFEDVLDGWVPGTEIRLGRMREGEHDHRPGWDITFSAPKSVSLEGLVVGDRRVIRAHDDAVRATLEWIERDLLQTRGWDPIARRRPRVAAEGMIVAGFRHLSSRGGDPQLHTHCVLANITRNASGEWRSVEPTMIRRSEKLIGAYYRNELARRLQALGMAVTPTLIGRVPGFELAGYDRAFLDAFSGQRAKILAYLEEHGLAYNARNTQIAALATRPAKQEIGLSQLVPQWRARARAMGLVRDKAALRPARPVDPATGRQVPHAEVPPPDLPANELRSLRRAPKLPPLPREAIGVAHAPPGETAAQLSPVPETGVLEAVARAVEHVAERRTLIPAAEIRAVALGHAPGRYRLADIDEAIERLAASGALIAVERKGMDRAFVTREAVKAEKKILAFMRDGRGRGKALGDAETVEERLEESRLTRGQKEAVRTVLLSDDRIVGVQGHAGSGKTTMLREVKELLGGTAIHGLAPSAAAARVLGSEAGIPSTTLQWFLTRFGDPTCAEGPDEARAAYRGAVLAVDECSMIDTVRMRELLRIAGDLGVARIALVGDTAQLRAVDAGQPFRLLQKAGMKTATMDEVLRQEDPELREAVLRARYGEPEESIRGLRHDRVREVPRDALGEEAARCWLALKPEERADTAVMAPTHEIRRQTNEAIREGLAEEGTLRGRVLEIDRLVNRHLTRALAADIASYEPGDTVVFHRDAYGCRTNDVCTVMEKRDGRVILLHPDGKERSFRPSGNTKNYLGLFDTERIELRAGDRIRWTRNSKAPPVRSGGPAPRPHLVNGGEAEIVEIGHRRVRFRDGEREFSLARSDPQLRHLDHAYCTTVHAAQGKTAGGAIAILDAGGATDQAMFHVEISRVRRAFLLLTDDREALIELLESRAGGEEGALEALGIDPSAMPSEDAETFTALERDWRTLERRAAETDTVVFFLPGYRDVMARAAALAAVGDLPGDLRRLVDRMLAEHRRHLAHDREVRDLVRRIQEHGRRWPELGWAAETQGMDETAGHAAWREDAAALVEEGHGRLAAPGAEQRHLEAMSGAGLAGALAELERTRLLDDTGRFERLWDNHRERAATAGVPELLGEGYAEVAALGERIGAADGLDARTRETLAAWRAVHAEQAALAEEARALPERVAAWRALDGVGATESARLAWRAEGEALAALANGMLAPDADHAPWLDAAPGARQAARRAAAEVADTLGRDQREEFPQPEMESRPPHDAEAARLREEIRDWPGRARILLDHRPPDDAALDALTQWRERAEPLFEESFAMRRPDGPHARHLEAMPREREALDRATRRLDAAVAAVEVAETRQLMRSARAFEERGGGMRYDAPAYGPLMERVRSLDARPYLPESWRKTVDAVLGYDERRWQGRQPEGSVLDAAARAGNGREDPKAEARMRTGPEAQPPDGQEDQEREIGERIARDEQARAAAEAERQAGEQRRAAERARVAEEVRMAFERARVEGKDADDRREPEAGKERDTRSGQYDPRESARAAKEAGKLANRLDACLERRGALLQRAEQKLYSNQPVVDLGREHKRWRRAADRAVEAGRALLGDDRYASHLDGLGGRAGIEAAVDRLEKAAVLDHLPQRIVAGWEKLEDRVRETGAHRFFLPEHGRLCEAVDLLYPKDNVAHRFANGETALRKDMTLQAERLDLTAKRLEECARDRGRAEAGELPFVRQEGYAEWRFRAELAVGRARGILSERTKYAPHFERDPKLAKTLETLSAGLDRALRDEGAEWNRIRNERTERERHQDLDRSQDRGFSW